MGSDELLLIAIILFASPVAGVLLEFCIEHRNLHELRRFRILPPAIAVIASFILFLHFVVSGAEGAVEFSFASLGIFENTPISMNFTPFSAFVAFFMSSCVFLLNRGIINHYRDMLILEPNVFNDTLSQRFKGFAIFSNGTLFALLIMLFSSSTVLFPLGFVVISIAYLLLPDTDILRKTSVFKVNIILDFVLIFIIAIFIQNFNANNSIFTTLISLMFFLVLIWKTALTPHRMTKNIINCEIRILFLTFLRPALIFMILLRFNEIIFINTIACIVVIACVTIILFNSLISLYRANNSLSLIENVSTISVSALFLISVYGHIETLFLYFAGIVAANILLALSFQIFAARNIGNSTDLDDSSRFNLENFGKLKSRFSIIMFFIIISGLCVAGSLPFINGWANFSMFSHLTSSFTGYKVFIGGISFFVMNIACLLFIFAFSRTIYRVFFGEFRGKPEQLVKLNLPDKRLLIPMIVLMLFCLIGGIINISGNTKISGFLTDYIEQSDENSGILNDNLFSALSNTDLTVMILLCAIPFVILLGSFYLNSKNNDNTPEMKGFLRLDLIYFLETNLEQISNKIAGFINVIADFAYTIIERLILDTIFWFVGRLLRFFSTILRNEPSEFENPAKSLKRYRLGVVIVLILAILIALSAC